MKISEPLGQPSDYDFADDARRMEAEVLSQLKAEFQEFVAQTRERLRFVSESLIELERESFASPMSHPEIAAAEPFESVTFHDAGFEPSHADRSELHDDSEPVPSYEPSAPASQCAYWLEDPTEADQPPFVEEEASTDASFPESTESFAEVFTTSRPSPKDQRQAFDGPQASDRVGPDSDPTERLNAIKQRLARQIENS